jgi:hypothetical protein
MSCLGSRSFVAGRHEGFEVGGLIEVKEDRPTEVAEFRSSSHDTGRICRAVRRRNVKGLFWTGGLRKCAEQQDTVCLPAGTDFLVRSLFGEKLLGGG